MPKRVIFYIDGFNLYYGMISATRYDKYKNYKWLNLQLLAENIVKPFQEVVTVKYFTSNITGEKDKLKRQRTYIEALSTLPKIKIYYGTYQIKKSFDKNIQQHVTYPIEKKI